MGLHRQLLGSKLKPVLWLGVISALVVGSLFIYKWWERTPSVPSLEGKVKLISVRCTDGAELEIDPLTIKGKEIVSVCEEVLKRGLRITPRGAELLRPLHTLEDLENMRKIIPNVYLELEREYPFGIYLCGDYQSEVMADKLYFFVEYEHSSVSWAGKDPTPKIFDSDNGVVSGYPIDTNSRSYSKLVEIVDIIPEEQARAIAESALTSDNVTIDKVDSIELCVYHYPVCTPPGKTPPPTLAYKVKFTLENNPHKNYLCENRWVAAKHAVVEVDAYTGKPLRVGYLNPCDP